MRATTFVFLLSGMVAIVPGCAGTPEKAGDPHAITLTKGDTLAIAVGASGDVTTTVTITEGKPNAGTYTSTSKALLDDARAAKNALGEPGATVWIRADGRGEIVAIGWGQKLQ